MRKIHLQTLYGNPFRWWGDFISRRRPGIRPAASFEAADRANGHVVVAEDLAGQSHAGNTAGSEHVAFGDGHLIRFAFDKYDPARGTSRIAAASMQDVNARILLDSAHQTFSVCDFDRSKSFNSQLRHAS
jgi:hypothetical protein